MIRPKSRVGVSLTVVTSLLRFVASEGLEARRSVEMPLTGDFEVEGGDTLPPPPLMSVNEGANVGEVEVATAAGRAAAAFERNARVEAPSNIAFVGSAATMDEEKGVFEAKSSAAVGNVGLVAGGDEVASGGEGGVLVDGRFTGSSAASDVETAGK